MSAGDDTTSSGLPPDWPAESAQRFEKLKRLRAQGLNPYPTKFERSHTLGEIVAGYGQKTGEELEAHKVEVATAGRLLLKRPMGKAAFATLGDGDARLQVFLRKDCLLYTSDAADE